MAKEQMRTDFSVPESRIDKMQFAAREIPASEAYSALVRKCGWVLEDYAGCDSPRCLTGTAEYTAKLENYKRLREKAGDAVFYRVHSYLVEGRDTILNGYMFVDDTNKYIDFTYPKRPMPQQQ